MRKLIAALCFAGVLLSGCASSGTARRQNPNPELLGELLAGGDGGFSMFVPAGWEPVTSVTGQPMAGMDYGDGIAANIGFSRPAALSGSLSDAADQLIRYLSVFYDNADVFERDVFITDAGGQGLFITFTGDLRVSPDAPVPVRQRAYFFRDRAETTLVVVTGAAPAESGDRFDALFDASAKTFLWHD